METEENCMVLVCTLLCNDAAKCYEKAPLIAMGERDLCLENRGENCLSDSCNITPWAQAKVHSTKRRVKPRGVSWQESTHKVCKIKFLDWKEV